MPTQNEIKELLQSYKDICLQIEFYEILLKDAEYEWEINRRLMFGGVRSNGDGTYTKTPMDRVAINLDSIKERHDKLEQLISKMKRMKKEAEKIMGKFEGLEYKVAYKRYVENKTLKEIADELGYSEAWIKKVSMNISRNLEGTEQLKKT